MLKSKAHRYMVTACLLAAVDLFICMFPNMSGQVFGVPSNVVIVTYFSVAGLLLYTLVRLFLLDRQWWPLLAVWSLYHVAMMPAY